MLLSDKGGKGRTSCLYNSNNRVVKPKDCSCRTEGLEMLNRQRSCVIGIPEGGATGNDRMSTTGSGVKRNMR